MRKITCQCGTVIPYRHVYDHYRLTPRHKEVREKKRLGVRFSLLKRFLDRMEATTQRGETMLRFSTFAARGSRDERRYRHILKYCKSVGYLEYVCPQCERAVGFQQKKRGRRPVRAS